MAVAALGGDEHHAVGTARTVEHRSGSVLEDADAGDVIGVDGRNGAVERYAVDDVERRGRSVDRTEAADGDRRTRTGLTGTGSDLHAGSQAVQRLGDVGDFALLQFIALDHGDRTGERLLLGRTVSHDDDVADGLRLFAQDDVDARFTGNGDLFRIITEERHEQRTVGGSDDRETAVGPGGGACGCSLDEDGGTGNRIAVHARNCTGNLYVLGHGACQTSQNSHEEQYNFSHRPEV